MLILSAPGVRILNHFRAIIVPKLTPQSICKYSKDPKDKRFQGCEKRPTQSSDPCSDSKKDSGSDIGRCPTSAEKKMARQFKLAKEAECTRQPHLHQKPDEPAGSSKYKLGKIPCPLGKYAGIPGARYTERPLKSKLATLNPKAVKAKQRLKKRISVDQPTELISTKVNPLWHVNLRKARIFKPPKNCMQSGTDNLKHWAMDFDTQSRWENALIGWTSSGDPLSGMQLKFGSKRQAIKHCRKYGWKYFVQKPGMKKKLKIRSYGSNFSWNRRTRVSTK